MASLFSCFLGLYFMLLLMYCSQSSRILEGTLYIDGSAAIAKINEDFICATLDYPTLDVQNFFFPGNELNGLAGATIAADQYSRDVITLHKLVQDIYKGKDVMPLILAPGGIFDAVWFSKFIDKASNSLQVVTHHIYNVGAGNDSKLVQKILYPSHLDEDSKIFRNLQGILCNYGTSAVAWVGESGGVFNSGRDLVSNTFVSSDGITLLLINMHGGTTVNVSLSVGLADAYKTPVLLRITNDQNLKH
ncbi:hypothetical protein RND71_035830 [Anisodus tanguticus]|uniref:Uncharacterized protein n=1 Tax=Anisodus tanguticus TaxID=243964 RepID=A0AAE1V1W0_9SOLA|nr:hypothetical protein RND71_035830 [Anisodus tanguticus]